MSTNNRKKDLIKNTGIIAIGTLLSKALSFFLLPIYTRYLSTDSYGIIDLIQTFCSLLLPVVSLEVCYGIFRFLIDDKTDEEKKNTISTSFIIQTVIFIIFFILSITSLLYVDLEYYILFILYFLSLLLMTNVQSIARGFGNNKLYSLLGFLHTTISLVLNILFIVSFKMNANAILIAFIISNTITTITGIVRLRLFRYITRKSYTKSKAKSILRYSLPLIPNELSWWITNTSDRLLVSTFINAGANGIYAIANKIPTIYTTLFNVYNIAWVESVSKSINDDDACDYIVSMYKESFRFLACICMVITILISLFFNIIIGKNYTNSYFHILILMIAIFFNSLCSLIGSILTGYKASKSIAKTTILGAIVNIIINLLLIKKIGLYAASISTLVSYIVIFIARNISVKKYVKLKYEINDIVLVIVSLLITIVSYCINNKMFSALTIVYLIIFTFLLNKKTLLSLLDNIIKKIGIKRKN